jgi:serine/threonine protein kinase
VSELWLGERVHPERRRPVIRRIPDALPRELAEERLQRLVELRHPGIAQVIDWGRDKRGRLFVLREDVPGETLDAYSQRHRLGMEERVRLLEEAREALSAAHAAGIVHGRISPRKLLVVEGGGGPQAVLVGFEKGPLGEDFAPGADLATMDALSHHFGMPKPALVSRGVRARLRRWVAAVASW